MADRNVRGPTLSEKLRLAVESTNEPGNDLWYIMRQAVGNEEFHSFSDEEFWRFLLHLAELIERYDCTDIIFVAGVLEISWRSCLRDIHAGFIFDQFCHNRTHIKNWVLNRGFKNIFETSYKNAHYPDPHYPDAHYPGGEEDIVTELAITGQLGALELLLRFGAISFYPKEDRHLDWISSVKGFFPDINEVQIRKLEQSMISFAPTTKRRFMFVIRCLRVLRILELRNKSDSEIFEKHRASLRLYFKSIPEPFVTSKDISSTFDRLFRKSEILRDPRNPGHVLMHVRGMPFYKQFIDMDSFPLAKEFEEYFPDSSQPSGPRSLKHLCRFQVRENLRTSRSAFRLPQAIDSLPVAGKIKRYIALREEEEIMGLKPYELTPSRLPTPACKFRRV